MHDSLEKQIFTASSRAFRRSHRGDFQGKSNAVMFPEIKSYGDDKEDPGGCPTVAKN